ncbi:MAG: hypothetical protein VR64_18570 [Desulfatitalea sp. BRH_c12]|nr:MAG: hypothetical protein VR64_18570 [Desulfatitalea sp. BRH_c12]
MRQLNVLGCLLMAAVLLAGCTYRQQIPYWPNLRNAGQSFTHEDLRQFTDSIRVRSNDADYHYQLGRHFQSKGKFPLAAGEFRRALAIDPRRAEFYNALGVCYDKLMQFDLAKLCYRRVLELQPGDALAYNNMGYSYLLQGKAEFALPLLRQAAALDTDNVRFRNNIALAHYLSGDKHSSQQCFTAGGAALTAAPPAATPSYSPAAVSGVKSADTAGSVERSAGSPIAMLRDLGQQEIQLQDTVQVELCNGNGAYRMGTNLSRLLKARGFNVVRLTNADRFDYGRTSIVYGNGSWQAADHLARQLCGPAYPAGTLRNGPTEGRIKVLLGRDIAQINDLFNGRLPIVVANGNGKKDLAERVSCNLDEKGFITMTPVDGDHFNYAETRIIYPKGRLTCARLIARAIPGQVGVKYIKNTDGSAPLKIVVGKDLYY